MMLHSPLFLSLILLLLAVNVFTTLPFNSHAFDFTSVQLVAMKRSFLSKICFPTCRKVRHARMRMSSQDVICVECVRIRVFRSFETKRFLAEIRTVPALHKLSMMCC